MNECLNLDDLKKSEQRWNEWIVCDNNYMNDKMREKDDFFYIC